MNPETRTWLRRGALLAVALVAALLAWKTLRPASNDGSFVKGNGRIEAVEVDVAAKLARYCDEVQIAALAVDLFAPEKVQRAAQDARLVVATFCASPPRNLAGALASLAAAYTAIETARRG